MSVHMFQGLLGVLFIIAVCWGLSESRKNVNFKQVFGGLVVLGGLTALILHFPPIRKVFLWIGDGVMALKDATVEGTKFVFGYLGGGDLPFESTGNAFVFAFQILPMVIVISALAVALFHLNILPFLVKLFSKLLRKTMGIGGALGLCGGAQIFLGQTEAPILVRPYLKFMSRSELFSVMVMGMATTSATIMGLYAVFLEGIVASPISHILTASVIGVPSALMLSRVLVPHVEEDTHGDMVAPYVTTSTMDALSKGTGDGLRLYGNILAMLIVFVALVSLVNVALGAILPNMGGEPVTIQMLLGYILSPFVWLMGVPWEEAQSAASLLGLKTALNEVYAFIELAKIKGEGLSSGTRLIMTYALCGFANISSVGIMIGGLGSMVPDRRQDILTLSFKALLVGALASCLSATVVGLLNGFGEALAS